MSYCRNCGKELRNEDVFCPSCGTRVNYSSKDSFNSGYVYDGPAVKPGFFSFEGRASRKDYWIPVLVGMGVTMLITVVFIVISLSQPFFSSSAFEKNFNLLVHVMAITVNLVLLPLTVRRWHDLNRSGWMVLLFIVLGMVPILNIVSGLVNLIFIGFIRGTRGDNRYGHDPLAGRRLV